MFHRCAALGSPSRVPPSIQSPSVTPSRAHPANGMATIPGACLLSLCNLCLPVAPVQLGATFTQALHQPKEQRLSLCVGCVYVGQNFSPEAKMGLSIELLRGCVGRSSLPAPYRKASLDMPNLLEPRVSKAARTPCTAISPSRLGTRMEPLHSGPIS